MIILFPHVDKVSSVRTPPLVQRKDWIANSKAVAAQTFKSKAIASRFHLSKAWQVYHGLFTKQHPLSLQYLVNDSLDLLAEGDWIAYPFAVSDPVSERTCCVWIEETNIRKFVRHVRIYRDPDLAAQDNASIEEAIIAAGL